MNLRFWRLAAGLTQDELGQLTGLRPANISDAERSKVHGRRRFDASTIVMFATALGVPVTAFFLPPPDDGEHVRYVVATPDLQEHDMAGLARAALLFPAASPAWPAWQARLSALWDKYLDAGRGFDLADVFGAGETASREANLRLRDRLRGQRAALAQMIDDLDQAAAALDAEAGVLE